MSKLIPVVTPFTILVDTRENHPFRFSGLTSDSNKDYRELVVQHRWQGLGNGWGDYSIDGHQPDPTKNPNPEAPRVSIERKSVDDCIGTVLGFGERRGRFEIELANLSTVCSCVIVEGSMATVMEAVQQHGKKSREENVKTLFRSWIAYQQDYPVPWFFCDDRRLAEVTCFRFLERFWRKQCK